MALEIPCFRSLFRNTKQRLAPAGAENAAEPATAASVYRPVYVSAKDWWFFALLFHGSLLIVPQAPALLSRRSAWVDADRPGRLFAVGLPTVYLSDAALLAALLFLFPAGPDPAGSLHRWRRTISSLPDRRDAVSGLLMRHVFKVDLNQVKALAVGWATFSPAVPAELGAFFFVHLFLVCARPPYLPFGKIMHLAGVFLRRPGTSPATTGGGMREPRNAPVKVHPTPNTRTNSGQDEGGGHPVEREEGS